MRLLIYITGMLKICSWDIQGIQSKEMGHKLNDIEVKEKLLKYDIICPIETHRSAEVNMDLQGLTSVSLCRPKYSKAKKPQVP